MEDYELENWIGISSLRTLEMYFVRRAAVEDEYSTGLASLSSPLPCLSTTVAVDAHRAIASTCSQISLKMHSLRTQYKKSLYELSVQQRIFIKPFQDLESKKIAALKKDMFKKFSLWEQSEKDGSLGKSVKLLAEFKTADLLYRKGIQQLEDVKSEYATFIRNCIDTMTTFETNRLTLTRDSLSSFSVEENYRIMQLINDSPPNETLNIEQELEKSTTILKQTFSIPQVIYEHPQYTTQLKQVQYSHTNSKIPPILKQSITWLETRGLDKEGIYRLSGNQKNILELKTQFEKGFVLVPDYDVDINVITGIVKMFLRELPDPLFNFPANERQENSQLKEDEKIRQLNSMFWNLSSLKQEVFKFLVEHLARVIALSEKNKMNVGNIGVIFAPMLFDYSDALGGESPNRASTLFSRGGANLSGLEIYKQSTTFDDFIMYKSRIFAEMLSPVGSSLGSALSFKSSSPTIKSDSKEKLGKTQDSDTVTGFKRLLTRKTSSAKKPEPLTPKKVNAEAYHLDGFLGGAIKMQPVADMEDDDDEDSEEED